MKLFVTLLFASITLILFHTQVKACDLDPTASIEVSPNSDGVFFDGDYIYMDGYSSSANCGYISEFTWYIDLGPINQTVSTHAEYTPDFTLQPGQDSREIDILLRVKNTVGNYDYASITITILREHSSYYYLTDHLGSVRVTLDDDGNPVGWDDYYPFGLQMPGRTQNSSNPNEDIKFTGYELEQQCETDSSGGCINDVTLGLYHAGARMYDPVIGRFNSQDRFKEKYPSMSPYQYAALNPVGFIDVNGDSIWVVHGTWSDPSTFTSDALIAYESTLEDVMSSTSDFQWSGENAPESRQDAAIDLANLIKTSMGEDSEMSINIVGHSHGGNVAILASNILAQDNIQVDNLITLGTPSREDYQLSERVSANHVNVFSEYDAVQILGGFDSLSRGSLAGRRQTSAQNIDVTERISRNPLKSHSDMHSNALIIKSLKSFIIN